jgi:hypothetical protein
MRKVKLHWRNGVKNIDAAGIEKSIIMTMSTGKKFDSLYAKYAVYGNRFEVWCGFDYNGYEEPGGVKRP